MTTPLGRALYDSGQVAAHIWQDPGLRMIPFDDAVQRVRDNVEGTDQQFRTALVELAANLLVRIADHDQGAS